MPIYDRTAPVTLSLRLHRGTAQVTAADVDHISVEVVERGGADAADRFTIALDGDTLVVHRPESRGWSRRHGPKVDVTVRLPADSSVSARCAAADLHFTGRYATVHADCAAGEISVDDVTGDASLRTASGSISTRTVGGSLRLQSTSGDLRIGDVTRDVTARTASGSIAIGTVGGATLAETASGEIVVGSVARGSSRFTSASGDITVGVAAGTGVWLDLDTASGRTATDLAMDVPAPVGEAPALELRVRTSSGNIDVHRATGTLPAAA